MLRYSRYCIIPSYSTTQVGYPQGSGTLRPLVAGTSCLLNIVTPSQFYLSEHIYALLNSETKRLK